MSIEKMSLVQIEGTLRKVNKTLVRCCETNCFHMINNHNASQEYKSTSTNGFKTLKDKNPYTSLVNRATALANGLGIEIRKADYDDIEYNISVDFSEYLKELEAKFNDLSGGRELLRDSLKNHTEALMRVDQLAGFDFDFAELYACKYVKLRFGKLPIDSVPKLEYYKDKCFISYNFQIVDNYMWMLYLTPDVNQVEVDDIFNSLYFERVHMPDYFHGNADEAKSAVLRMIKDENEKLETIESLITELKIAEQDKFLKVFNKLRAFDQGYELRQNVLVVNGKFYMSGYVPSREFKRFRESFVDLEADISIQQKPLDSEPNANPPVKLRNLWLFRPFEMFVKMYGLPDYNGFDPTPYVAITFMLMYGIMFGDLGQGLLISLFGFILTRWKNVKLGPVMERIGITSALFGTLYGSVFGNEELIEPFFKKPGFYKALGYAAAPEDIFQVSTILLIAAVVIGVTLIVISMMMNVITSLRNHKVGDAIISPNGVVGLVFYVAVMAGAGLQLGFGIEMFTTPYLLAFVALPLLLLFFKEPVIHLFTKLFKGTSINRNVELVHAVKSYSDAVSEIGFVTGETACSIDELLTCSYVKAQYGRLPIENYAKLDHYRELNFFFYPFENDDKSVSGVFLTPSQSFAVVERVFEGFGFKKMKMPEHIGDIRKETKLHLDEYVKTEKKEKKSVGNFIIEGVIELFEGCLTYITNTMSFLRIGGFILSHAGMMLVVNVLANQTGGGVGFIIVQIIGNIFVIGMEGFLVGIQVLRLEFYEIFSRFYKGGGKPFSPVVVDIKLEQ